MGLTLQELRTLRDIVLSAVHQTYDVLLAATLRAQREQTEAPAPTRAAPPVPLPSKRLTYGVKDAAEALGISKSVLYVMMSRGELRTVRIGSRRLIEAAEIEALLEKGRSAR